MQCHREKPLKFSQSSDFTNCCQKHCTILKAVQSSSQWLDGLTVQVILTSYKNLFQNFPDVLKRCLEKLLKEDKPAASSCFLAITVTVTAFAPLLVSLQPQGPFLRPDESQQRFHPYPRNLISHTHDINIRIILLFQLLSSQVTARD